MKPGTTLQGAGPGGTVLVSGTAMPAVIHLERVGGPMTVIRDLFICGPLGGNWNCDGIFLDGTNGVTIRDCWLGAFRRGIYMKGVSDHWLRNLLLEHNQHAIYIVGGNLKQGELPGPFQCNLRMYDCSACMNYQGAFHVENLRGAQIHGCTGIASGYFLSLKRCANVTITGGSANWSGPYVRHGVRIEECFLITMTGCSIDGQAEYGLSAIDSRLMTISDNVFSNTRAGPAVRLENCAQSSFRGNVLSQSLGASLHLSGVRDLIVARNVIEGHGQVIGGYASARGDESARSKFALVCDGESSRCSFVDNIVQPNKTPGDSIHIAEDSRAIEIRSPAWKDAENR